MDEPVLLSGAASSLFEIVPRVRWETDFQRFAALRRQAVGSRDDAALSLAEVTARWLKYASAGVSKNADGFVVSRTLSPGTLRALERAANPPWHAAVSPCREYLALLEDDAIEIASRANNFDFGRTKRVVELDFDPFRGWRKVAWSHDSKLLAIAGSDGGIDIVNLQGQRLVTILNEIGGPGERPTATRRRHYVESLPGAEAMGKVGILDPIAILRFVDPSMRHRSGGQTKGSREEAEREATHELFVAGYDGVLRSYLIDSSRIPSNVSFQDTLGGPLSSMASIFLETSDEAGVIRFSHRFSFAAHYSIVSAGLVDAENKILIVCGQPRTDSETDDVSFWKLTDSAPFLSKLGAGEKETSKPASILDDVVERVAGLFSRRSVSLDVSLSPDGKLLATVGTNGELKIWSHATGRCVREYDREEAAFIIEGIEEESLAQIVALRAAAAASTVDADGSDDEDELDAWSESESNDSGDNLAEENESASVMAAATMTSVSSKVVVIGEARSGDEGQSPLPILVAAKWWSDRILVLFYSSGHAVFFDAFGDVNRGILNLRFPTCPRAVVVPEESVFLLYQDASVSDSSPRDRPNLSTIVTAPFHFLTNVILWHWDTEDTLTPPAGHQPRSPRFNLSSIHLTTPLDALRSRIRHGQYAAALDLCAAFDLDTDPVFKAQFDSLDITPLTIETVLSKVKDDYYVLEACSNRIPEDPATYKVLLEFGLRKTAMEEDMMIDDVLELLEDERDRMEDGYDFGRDMLMVDLCRYRTDLLAYMDRLRTFEEIALPDQPRDAKSSHELSVSKIRGSAPKPQNFSSAFTRFRDRSLLAECLERAYRGDFHAIQVLFTRHGSDCLPFRFAILETVAETVVPSSYAFLLPRVATDGMEKLWDMQPWREDPDWVEDERIVGFVDKSSPASASEPFTRVAHPASGEFVRDWTIARIRAIDRLSGLERNALQLAEFGMDICSIQGDDLELLVENLRTLCQLLYGGLPAAVVEAVELTLAELETLEPMQVVRLMLSSATTETVVEAIRGVLRYPSAAAQRHWTRLEKMVDPQDMVRAWLREMAAEKRIALCCEAIEASSPWSKEPGGRLTLGSDSDVTELILDSCYRYPAIDEAVMGYMNRMFDCLPEIRDLDRVSTLLPQTSRQMLGEDDQLEGPYADRIRVLDRHLVCCEILAKMDAPTPLSALATYESNVEMQNVLVKKLARRAKRPEVFPSPVEEDEMEDEETLRIEKLQADLIVLRNLGVLGHVSESTIYKEVLASVLGSGQFEIAKRLLAIDAGALGDDLVEDIVVATACEFFDNASSGDRTEGGLKLAEDCLHVVPATARIRKELDLILATDELYRYKVSIKEGLEVLPIQVRLSENRLDLVLRRIRIDKNAPYRADRILTLAHRLGFKANKLAEVRVYGMLVDAALDNGDFNKAYDLSANMIRLIKEGQVDLGKYRKEIWKVCRRLGADDRFANIEARLEIVSFALALSPTDEMAELVDIHSRLEEMLRVEELSDPARTALYGLRRGLSDVILPVIWRRGGSEIFDARKVCDDIEATLALIPNDLATEMDTTEGVSIPDLMRQLNDLSLDRREALGLPNRYDFVDSNVPPELRRLADLARKAQAVALRLAAHSVLIKVATQAEFGADRLDSLLSSSALELLSVDTAQALSLLLDVVADDAARPVFDQLYPSSFNEQLALYYYSLRCLCELASASGSDADPKRFPPYIAMRSLVTALSDPVWDKALESADNPTFTQANKAVANVQTAAKALRSKREDQLLHIACDKFGVSRSDFEMDEQYRQQALVKMMAAADATWLANVLFLGATWNIPRERMVVSYLRWLFLESRLGAEQIDSRVLSVTNEGTIGSSTAAILDDVLQIHADIRGDLWDVVACYYALLRSGMMAADSDGAKGLGARQAALDDLMEIEGLGRLDFKYLVRANYQGEEQVVEFLVAMSKDLLSIEPVIAVVPNMIDLRLLPIFPEESELAITTPPSYDLAHLISTFALSHTRQLVYGALSTTEGRGREVKFVAAERSLSNMLPDELSVFLRQFCVGEESRVVPLKHRLSYASEAIGIFPDRSPGGSSDAGGKEAEAIHQHLKALLDIQHIRDPSGGATISEDLAQRADASFSDPASRKALCQEMIAARQSPYLVHRMADCLSRMPDGEPSVGPLLDTCALYSEALARAAEHDPEHSLPSLSEIVTSVITYETLPDQSEAEYQWLALLEDAMLTKLRALSADSSIDPTRRRSIMEIINRNFVLKEEELTELRAIKVQEIIRTAFGKEVPAAELEQREKRLQIFLALLESLTEEEDAVLRTAKMDALQLILEDFTEEIRESGATELPQYLHACWGYFLKWLVAQGLDSAVYNILVAHRTIPLVDEEEEQEILSILLVDRPDIIPYFSTGILAYHANNRSQVLERLAETPEAHGLRLVHILLALQGLLASVGLSIRSAACTSILRVPRGSDPNLYRALLRHAVASLINAGDFSSSAKLAAGYLGGGQLEAHGLRGRIALLARVLAIDVEAVVAPPNVATERSGSGLEVWTIANLLPATTAVLDRAKARLAGLRESWT